MTDLAPYGPFWVYLSRFDDFFAPGSGHVVYESQCMSTSPTGCESYLYVRSDRRLTTREILTKFGRDLQGLETFVVDIERMTND